VLVPPDGVRIDLFFYEGAWTGLDVVHPLAVGEMNVVMVLEAPNAALKEALKREITEILASVARES